MVDVVPEVELDQGRVSPSVKLELEGGCLPAASLAPFQAVVQQALAPIGSAEIGPAHAGPRQSSFPECPSTAQRPKVEGGWSSWRGRTRSMDGSTSKDLSAV